VSGRYGTLSEIAFAIIAKKPVASLGSWELVEPGGGEAPVHHAESAAAAVDYCEAAASRG
jgi:hypothetical protein